MALGFYSLIAFKTGNYFETSKSPTTLANANGYLRGWLI
jgi:hypothetical protein